MRNEALKERGTGNKEREKGLANFDCFVRQDKTFYTILTFLRLPPSG
jgi:hypothetical protein